MKKTIRNKIYILGAFVFLLSSSNPVYSDSSNSFAFSKYQGGKIYIGNYSYLSRCLEFYKEGDVFVLDQREKEDNPSMKVYTSYKITNKEDRCDIIDSLLQYEEMNPSMWDRSRDSMKLEWYMHNISYSLNHKRDSSIDVDFDNKDEEVYNSKILVKMMNL